MKNIRQRRSVFAIEVFDGILELVRKQYSSLGSLSGIHFNSDY